MVEREIKIPVTRIEGHARITITLDDNENVADAKFHVIQLRGFEKFCEGRPLWEMPVITSRICGICPISHSLASAKAGEAILGIEIPGPAKKLRMLLHMGQIIQSHALSIFYLSLPDLLLGYDYDIRKRNLIGLLECKPELAKKGLRLRKFGQEIIENLSGRRVHPKYSILGGVSKSLDQGSRLKLSKQIDNIIYDIKECLKIIKNACFEQEHKVAISTYFMSLVSKDNGLEFYDGKLKIKDYNGEVVDGNYDPNDYLSIIGERVEDWSYLKFPYYKGAGFPKGSLIVGPLGRLNVADKISTPMADEEFSEFKKLKKDGVINEMIYYHYARIIEMLYAAEMTKKLLADDEIVSKNTWKNSKEIKNTEGVGIIEAPRGSVLHHYLVDDDGAINKINLIVATAFNNMAMNLAIKEIALKTIKNGKLNKGILNHIEAAIRCFDPCLSCSTHMVGRTFSFIQLLSSEGKVIDEIPRKVA
ncbi:MAG: Ni/Fe hydrogenase subunit alpha [Candidatus Bathyarchaeota archaeon]|nr:Ni/Fe hydrogenase subunit alpha [Candidatus Bathyarchaeota archaeon]